MGFALFPDLPLEIRNLIWERAVPGPRLVEIRQRRLKKTIAEWETENETGWLEGTPETFSVWERKYIREEPIVGTFAQTYFNFDRDILYIRHLNFGPDSSTKYVPLIGWALWNHPMIDVENLHRVEKLAMLLDPIDDSAWDTPEATCNDYLAYGMLDILGNVQTLFPVLRHYEDSALPENYEFLTSKCLLEKPIAIKETIDSFQKNAVPRTLLILDPTVNLQALEAMKADPDLGGVFQAPIIIEPRVVVETGWKRILDDALIIFPDIVSSHGRQKTVTTRRCPIELTYE